MSLTPDPSVIGGVATPQYARLPDPGPLFARRAARLRHLAQASNLGPYLRFLADLCDAQGRVVAALDAPQTPDPAMIDRNRSYRMPPIDRAGLIAAAEMGQILDALLAEADKIEMPGPARAALDALRDAPASDRHALLAELTADRVPEGFAAPAAFAAAALQIAAARAASVLDPAKLVPIRVGTCPACGGRPGASLVTATQHQEGARYACCATCATQWNEVRVKCLCCGSTKGIGYRAIDDGSENAVIKAEVCDECHSWVKIFYQNRDTALEAVADDIASLGLDALLRDSDWRRGGFNPYLMGY